MTTKERKNQLITMADEVIRGSVIYKNGEIISESYNGQIAAFPVSVALSGLKPTMVLYYNRDSGSSIDKRAIVKLLAEMYNKDKKEHFSDEDFFNKVINDNTLDDISFKRLIIEYAIALKLTLRTFKMRKNNESKSA